MRRNRTKTRQYNKTNNTAIIIAFVILLPIISICIGYFGTKYILIPKFLNQSTSNQQIEKKQPENNNEDSISNDTSGNLQDANQEQGAVESNSNNNITNDYKKYSLELPPLSIFNIQVGSFSDMSYAQTQINELNSKDLKGYIIESDKYKVIVRSFLDRENAEKYREEIKKYYSDAFIYTINIPVRAISYGEEGKNYSQTASSQAEKLIDFYNRYYEFLISNNLSDVDTEKLLNFVDNQISILDEIKENISKVKVSNEFQIFNDNFMQIIENTSQKLKKLKDTSVNDRQELWKIFMESVNRYSSIIQ